MEPEPTMMNILERRTCLKIANMSQCWSSLKSMRCSKSVRIESTKKPVEAKFIPATDPACAANRQPSDVKWQGSFDLGANSNLTQQNTGLAFGSSGQQNSEADRPTDGLNRQLRLAALVLQQPSFTTQTHEKWFLNVFTENTSYAFFNWDPLVSPFYCVTQPVTAVCGMPGRNHPLSLC